jgi:hypothetical protein
MGRELIVHSGSLNTPLEAGCEILCGGLWPHNHRTEQQQEDSQTCLLDRCELDCEICKGPKSRKAAKFHGRKMKLSCSKDFFLMGEQGK